MIKLVCVTLTILGISQDVFAKFVIFNYSRLVITSSWKEAVITFRHVNFSYGSNKSSVNNTKINFIPLDHRDLLWLWAQKLLLLPSIILKVEMRFTWKP